MKIARALLVAVAVGAVAVPLSVLDATRPATVVPPPGAVAVGAPPAEPQADGPTATPTPPPAPVVETLDDPPVVQRGDGKVVQVPGGSQPTGSGPLRRYTVSVEGGLGIDPVAFAASVDATLSDPRSWGADGRGALQRVSGAGPVDFKVVLASPTLTDRLCAPLTTEGLLSCGINATAVLNSLRWLRGADAYEGQLSRYRQYLVNHEVGHTLGRGHEACRSPGALAPVMMQQSITVGDCRPSPWPYP